VSCTGGLIQDVQEITCLTTFYQKTKILFSEEFSWFSILGVTLSTWIRISFSLSWTVSRI
jgi:hypothetical protein